MSEEILLPLAIFGGGVVAGLLARWAPLSGWVALAMPLLVPPAGMGLAMAFC